MHQAPKTCTSSVSASHPGHISPPSLSKQTESCNLVKIAEISNRKRVLQQHPTEMVDGTTSEQIKERTVTRC
jgi:hypothetical protein